MKEARYTIYRAAVDSISPNSMGKAYTFAEAVALATALVRETPNRAVYIAESPTRFIRVN